jgi:hypothetical protein
VLLLWVPPSSSNYFQSHLRSSMDPITITTSVVGIIISAVKVGKILNSVVSTLNDPAKFATAISVEVSQSITILTGLQHFLDNLDAAPYRRRQLIHVDHLVVTFTDGVLLFSELEAAVVKLGKSPETLRSRIQWARKEKTFQRLLLRMQYFKGSTSVMLNILQRYIPREGPLINWPRTDLQ